MGLAILHCRAQFGTGAPPVTIEVFLSGGLPTFTIVGMAETAVRESKDRVRGALLCSGFEFPQQRITVNLGPASMKKSGGRYDLAIALAILAAKKQFPVAALEKTEIYGELALNGELRGVSAALPAVLAASKLGHSVIIANENAQEASLASDAVVVAATLREVVDHLAGRERLQPVPRCSSARVLDDIPDLADVRGQDKAKRALEIAASGGHNLLFVGPPGTGKSMLSRRLPGILPDMTEGEALETAAIDSILGKEIGLEHWRRRPFRSPHHTATPAAMIGGGPGPQPGEVSRAHNGVLFLDEFPEFNRRALEVLREPMETGAINIARASGTATYPANFQLVAAMNPCPCGYLGEKFADCNCSAEKIANYRRKISGPLLDRIDLQVEVGRPPVQSLRHQTPKSERSSIVRSRVTAAWDLQMQRSGACNAKVDNEELERLTNVDDKSWQLLERAVEQFNLSPRAHHRILRVARTIADLADSSNIAAAHVAEALSLRCFDRR